MAACAGVQNVSRPIERCQEMSQMMPTFALVAATSAAATYQGRCAARRGGLRAGAAAAVSGVLVTRTRRHPTTAAPPLQGRLPLPVRDVPPPPGEHAAR